MKVEKNLLTVAVLQVASKMIAIYKSELYRLLAFVIEQVDKQTYQHCVRRSCTLL